MQNTYKGQTPVEAMRTQLSRAEQCSRANYLALECVLGTDSAPVWIGTRGEKSVKTLHSLAEKSAKLAGLTFNGRKAVLTVRGFKLFAWNVTLDKSGKFYAREENGHTLRGEIADLIAACGKDCVKLTDAKEAATLAGKLAFDKRSFAFAGIQVKEDKPEAKTSKKEAKK
jgi:hypothetical protein